MGRLFSAKVRNVGTSLGILIPKKVVIESNIKEGQEIEVSVLKRDPERLKKIMKTFGSARGASGFKRDCDDDRIERWKREKNSSR